ncbi:EAL domain-containing protein [Lyngbya sp. CCY1209]|uniref:putative bifunctional diguanylate cyclase/phosphodiesterase n=1 Tax=Lyngbya sp. CCY1209 TaxID=2886103 RepID=UPI002D204098|nr:EAL domain-containing protein [Lyngbya sp. CCY1209]MEB3885440.1 EAL domain-containing protein [Lyngbya sp. CCY1209]
MKDLETLYFSLEKFLQRRRAERQILSAIDPNIYPDFSGEQILNLLLTSLRSLPLGWWGGVVAVNRRLIWQLQSKLPMDEPQERAIRRWMLDSFDLLGGGSQQNHDGSRPRSASISQSLNQMSSAVFFPLQGGDGNELFGLLLAGANRWEIFDGEYLQFLEAIATLGAAVIAELPSPRSAPPPTLETMIQTLPEGLLVLDDSRAVRLLNSAGQRYLELLSQPAIAMPLTHLGDLPISQLIDQKTARIVVGNPARRVWEASAIALPFNPQNYRWAIVLRDVSHLRGGTGQIPWQAQRDPLTGLLTRREFEAGLERVCLDTKSKSEPKSHTLCYLDLDRFKSINDTCGFQAGDELLIQISALLKSEVRKTDIVGHLGGDEFVILLHNCPLEQGLQFAHRLREKIAKKQFAWQNQLLPIGASIGLTEILPDVENVASVMRAADSACYAAKQQGRNQVYVHQFGTADTDSQQASLHWIQRLNRAIAEDRFCLYSQKIAPTSPELPQGEHYEILLRLLDETGQIILPQVFIPIAERYNLMPAIDRWVIRKVFQYLSGRKQFLETSVHIPAPTHPACLYKINLSGASLNSHGLCEFILEQLYFYKINPQTICFEITETVAITNLVKTAKMINYLKGFGFRFALDDFGAGMSSFAYLKNLPVDYIKIDGQFIRNIVTDTMDAAIVEAIHRFSQVIGMKTIAEFVENNEIFMKIQSLGVDYAQGFAIEHPGPWIHDPDADSE